MIRGIDVILHEKVEEGKDPFGQPIYSTQDITISNVLVEPVTNEDAVNELNLTGKRIAYRLALPKGDNHDWNGALVSFFGKTFRAVGESQGGIEELIPLRWNKKVKVEVYSGSED